VTVVADASPLIILAKLDCFDLLKRLFHAFASPLTFTTKLLSPVLACQGQQKLPKRNGSK